MFQNHLDSDGDYDENIDGPDAMMIDGGRIIVHTPAQAAVFETPKTVTVDRSPLYPQN